MYAIDATGATVATGSGSTVAYVAKNGSAQYVVAGPGALSTAGRNTFPLSPIDNIDAALTKRFNITERMKLQIGMQVYNVLNHAQYTSGWLNDIQPRSFIDTRAFLLPSSPEFGKYQDFYSSNSRSLQLVGKEKNIAAAVVVRNFILFDSSGKNYLLFKLERGNLPKDSMHVSSILA